MIIDFKDSNILNAYLFGSHLYGTNLENSDKDYIIVTKEYVESDSTDIHFITEKEFQRSLDNHDIQALECYFAPEKFKYKETVKFNFNLDKKILRKSISTLCDNSWVKGEKKLTINADYDKYVGIKSIFHSIRIRDFGIQIANEGKIYDFSRYNYVYFELLKLSEKYHRNELWDVIKKRYKELFNNLRSEFIILCPKPDNYKIQYDKIKKVFNRYNYPENKEFIDEILRSLGK